MVNDETIDGFLATVMRENALGWPENWPSQASGIAVWDRIHFHGIAIPLCEGIVGLTGWPENVLTSVREEARMQTMWEESHLIAMRTLCTVLAEDGVDALISKGTAFAYSVYELPAMRRRGDTDLLVKEAQLEQARSALEKSGFVLSERLLGLFYQEVWTFDTGIGFIHMLDLHWQVTNSPVLQDVLVVEECFERAVPLPRLAASAMALDPVSLFVHGCINQAWHKSHGYLVDGGKVSGARRLIWALDNHLMALGFTDEEWSRLASLGEERGIAAIITAALEFARDNFGTSIPVEIVDRLANAPQLTPQSKYLLHTDQAAGVIADLNANRSLRGKIGFLFAYAFPARRHIMSKYPDCTGWPLPALYIRRGVGLVVRLARRKAV